MIKAIHAGIPGWADEPEEQAEMLEKYQKYGDQVSHKMAFQSISDHFVAYILNLLIFPFLP